jgi:transposase
VKSFLTDDQVLILKTAHKHQKEKKLADRIKAVLMLHNGFTYVQIEMALLLGEITVRRYVLKFKKSGINGLLEINYHGGQSKLLLAQKQQLKQYLQFYTLATVTEIVSHIHKTYGIRYSIVGATKLLHKLGFVYKKPKIVPGKSDKERQQQFLDTYNQIKNNLGTKDQIYFVDSTHPTHNTQLSYGWILKGKANDKFIKTNNGRGRLNLNGALSLNDKSTIILDEKTVNSESTIRLLDVISHKQKHGKAYIILDNASHHHAKIVRGWLLHHPRFKLIFLPPYSPNLNLIERLWKFFHKRITNNHYFETFEEFKETTFNFFNNLKIYDKELSTLLTDNFRLAPEANFQT